MDIPRKDIEPKKKHGKFNIILFIILLFIIISTSIGAYLNSIEIDMQNISVKELFENKFYLGEKLDSKEALLEMAYDSNTNAKFTSYNNYIVRCTQNKIDFIDKKGEVKKTFRGSFKNPLIKTSGDYLLIANVKDKDIIVFKGINKLWEKKLTNNIINADINEKGHVAVVHQEERSRNAVSAFNNEGTQYFIDKSGDEFILSADVSPKGDDVLLNYTNTLGINATTDLKKYNIKSKQQRIKTFEKDFFFFAKYIDDDTIIAIGDSYITVLKDELEEKCNIPIDGKISSFDVIKGKHIIIAVGTGRAGVLNNSKSDIIIYDMDGVEIAKSNIEDEVESLVAYDDIIAINSGKKLYIKNLDGKLINEYSFKTDIEYVEFFNKKEILVIAENKIFVLNTL